MEKVECGSQISMKNILFPTDFSGPSEAALPFATSIARGYGAKVFALHVYSPDPDICHAPSKVAIAAIEAEEKRAKDRVESQLAGLEHETIVEWNTGLWEAVEKTINANNIDLIVLGTHGRTGADKLLMGSVAEEIFRRSPVPVLTIGPGVRTSVHGAGRFHRVLFATDFRDAALAAVPYAVSLSQGNNARLLLLHVMRLPQERYASNQRQLELSVEEANCRLYECVPKDAQLQLRSEVLVEYGEPAERILGVAKKHGCDLIVLGVRDAAGHIGAATHLERATAHKVVAHALCPVLTVRSKTFIE
jgi:nucleotide-binding universal stress UspA family protein